MHNPKKRLKSLDALALMLSHRRRQNEPTTSVMSGVPCPNGH